MHVEKTKALISSPVNAKLIGAFVFAYAECWFFPCGGSYLITIMCELHEQSEHNRFFS